MLSHFANTKKKKKSSQHEEAQGCQISVSDKILFLAKIYWKWPSILETIIYTSLWMWQKNLERFLEKTADQEGEKKHREKYTDSISSPGSYFSSLFFLNRNAQMFLLLN